jgi:acetyl esterase/lipase
VVRGPGGGIRARLIAGLLWALALGSCAGGAGSVITDSTAPGSTVTTVTSGTTTSTAGETSTTPSSVATTTVATVPAPEIDAEVLIPDGEPPFPAVVLVHGGGWVGGDPTLMRPLARLLTENGYLTVNTAYTLAAETPGYPAAVDDVACAVGLARAHPDSDGSVVVLGHSAGAHLAAVVALDGARYGGSCLVPGPLVPDRLVGLAGPYDVSRLGILMSPFFGGGPGEEPVAWVNGNPMNLVDHNTELSSLLMYGEEDGFIAPSFTIDFGEALTGAGSDALVEAVEGARHNDMFLPGVVGDLILAWLEE